MAGTDRTLVGIVAAALVVGLALLALQIVHLALPSGTLSVHCEEGNLCTADFLRTDGTCEHHPYPDTKGCHDACYTSGACNGDGKCVGTEATCKATCDSDNDGSCDNLFEFDDIVMDAVGFFWETACFGDHCGAHALYIDSIDGVEVDGYAGIQCKDLLTASFWAANGSCITIREFQLDFFMINDWEEWPPFLDTHECQYSWNCGHNNDEWISDVFLDATALATRQATYNLTSSLSLAQVKNHTHVSRLLRRRP